jgi:outer membrane lipoprotein-sorting protein
MAEIYNSKGLNNMRRLKSILLLVIFLSVLSPVVSGNDTGLNTGLSKIDEILDRIKQASQKVETLQGDFIQKKKVKIVKDMPDSSGRMLFKGPDCLRWEILKPVKMGFIINGDHGRKWQGDEGRVKKFDVSKDPVISVISNQVFAWARGDYERLKTGYDLSVVSEAPVEIKLVPLSPVEKKYIDSIILAFSENETHVSRIEILEKKGGLTQIFFSNMIINKELQEDLF